MTSDIIFNIFESYDRGEITDDQFKKIFSAECVSQWNKNILWETGKVGLLKRLPNNPLESTSFQFCRLSSDYFVYFLKKAWNSKNRENIVWCRWSSTIIPNLPVDKFNIWKDSNIWQSINFRNYLIERENRNDLFLKTSLIKIVGLVNEVSLESFGLEELIHRSYTLINFAILANIDSNELETNETHRFNECNKVIVLIVKSFRRINNRIIELEEETGKRLRNLYHYSMAEKSVQKQSDPNLFFTNFLNDSKNIEIGDALIEILCILSNQLSLITIENIILFLGDFFDKKPSVCSVIYVMKFVQKMFPKEYFSLISVGLRDNPIYIKEVYKTSSKVLLPKYLIRLLPLKMRVHAFLRSRFSVYIKELGVKYELTYIEDSSVNDLGKFLEMVQMFAWNNISILEKVVYLRMETSSYEVQEFQRILENYFKLFLKNELFYTSIESTTEERPIIRLLPLFPVSLWDQFGYLITRAALLRIQIPFIIDFDFFEAAFNPQGSRELILSLHTRITIEDNILVKDLYLNLDSERDDWRNAKFKVKLRSFHLQTERINQFIHHMKLRTPKGPYKIPTSSEARFLYDGRKSIEYGLKCFANGIERGMNIDDFTAEEAHKLIFYS